MKVKCITPSDMLRDSDGGFVEVGQTFTVDPAKGNPWAALGYVVVIEHDAVPAPPVVKPIIRDYAAARAVREYRREYGTAPPPTPEIQNGSNKKRPARQPARRSAPTNN